MTVPRGRLPEAAESSSGSRIVWLASYPKSGNTWVRALLANLLSDADTPVSINRISDHSYGAASRSFFDETTGLSSSDLSADEIDRLRPHVYVHLARRSPTTLYLKVHDAFRVTSAGGPLFPPAATRAAIYITRHPCDVAISLAHHYGIDIDRAVDRLTDDHTLSGTESGLAPQLPQRLLDWSAHVRSWRNASSIACLTVRYEDMLHAPERTFGAILTFLGLSDRAHRLPTALSFCRFDELQRQEAEQAFDERHPASSSPFFRSGKAGEWRRILSREQIRRIVANHGAMMRELGYIDADV